MKMTWNAAYTDEFGKWGGPTNNKKRIPAAAIELHEAC